MFPGILKAEPGLYELTKWYTTCYHATRPEFLVMVQEVLTGTDVTKVLAKQVKWVE